MSQAKHNPMSPQFRGQYPSEVPLAAIDVIRHPTPEWFEEHRDWKETGLPIPDEHSLVSLMLVIKRVEPSALFPGQPAKWPSSDEIALGPLLFMQVNVRGEQEAIPATMPLEQFRKLTPIGEKKAAEKEPAVMLEDEVSVTGS